MKILNLTQHSTTPEQRDSGVVDLSEGDLAELRKLLTFGDPPSYQELLDRAEEICNLFCSEFIPSREERALGYQSDPRPAAVMIGGAPFLMPALTDALRRRGIRVLFAFSRRESEEKVQPDGSVRKVAVFRHLGFVEVMS